MASIEPRLKELLNKIAKEQKFEDYDLQITPISTDGANFSSILYVSKVTSRTNNVLDLFIKISQIGMKIREDFKITIFETEKFIYSELRNSYAEIEEKHEVPRQHRLYIAKYYGADTTPPCEILVLENLAIQGYSLHDRFKSMDWEYASAAVTELAKLHSLSLAYQREQPQQFKHFSENHQYVWLNEHTLNSLWKPGFEKTISVAPEKHKNMLKKFFAQYDLEKLTRQYDTLRCKVLTHGDYRPSNLMHKKTDDGNLQMVVVDHQNYQIGCPVIDLLYLIFTGTDKEFRSQYFDKLVQFYYDQFSHALKRLDIDPESTYSQADYDFEMKEKLPFGLATAAFTLPIVLVEAKHAPEMKDDMDLSCFVISTTSKLYVTRMNDIVEDFIQWGILKED